MIVREYNDSDLARIKELHAQSGFDYSLPSLSGETFFSRRVVEGDHSIGMASFLRLTAEAFLICDPEWRTPAWRLEGIKQLTAVCTADCEAAGVQEVEAFLPPSLSPRFGQRLAKMNWSKAREGWISYSKRIR